MTFVKAAAVAVVAAVVAASVSLAAQSGPRRDGNWEVTTTMEMPGMPAGMAMPPMKSMQCITKEQANNPNSMVPPRPQRGRGNDGDCTVTDQKITGNKITFNMKCTGAQPMTGTGEITYAGDTYTSALVTNMERGGQAMQMTMKSTGKRLGDCVK
jgi:hypothetical protein